MSQSAKREYLKTIIDRYRKASFKEKSAILDEFCKVCGYHRNYAIRRLNAPLRIRRKKPGPKRKYDDAFIQVLAMLWRLMRRICSKKMVAAIPVWLPRMTNHSIDEATRKRLLQISAATIDRLLRPYRAKECISGYSLTGKATSFVKRVIPLKPLDFEYKNPGYMQADTVAHCGSDITGTYAHSLTLTDIVTTWTENRATWSKSGFLVCEQVKDIEASLPFPILGYSADNGTEVLNERLYDYFTKRPQGKAVEVMRGRPYRKNDQAYVEQKNNTHVRGLFGYERMDERSWVPMMNSLYKDIWNPLQNFFIPTMKCIEKIRVGSRVVKKYDEPKTPYQRVLESTDISQEVKDRLKQKFELLDPIALTQELESKQRTILGIVKRKNQRLAS